MKKINEDVAITDPALMQQYSSGQKQLLDKDTQINALQKQIADIQAAKIPIQKAMAEIEQKAGVEQQAQQVDQQAAKAVAPESAPVAGTNEGLLIKEGL